MLRMLPKREDLVLGVRHDLLHNASRASKDFLLLEHLQHHIEFNVKVHSHVQGQYCFLSALMHPRVRVHH